MEASTRSKEEVQLEYNKFCAMAGEAQFKMKACEADLFELNKKLVALHQEFSAALEKEKTNETTT